MTGSIEPAVNIKNYTCTPVDTQRAHEPVLIPIKQRSNIETNIEGPSKLEKKKKMEICEPYIQATFWIMVILVVPNLYVGIHSYGNEKPLKIFQDILDSIKSSSMKLVVFILGIIIPAIFFALWLHFKIKSNLYPWLFELFAVLFAISFTLFSLFVLLAQMHFYNISKDDQRHPLNILIKIVFFVSPIIMFSQWYWTDTVDEAPANSGSSFPSFITFIALLLLLVSALLRTFVRA